MRCRKERSEWGEGEWNGWRREVRWEGSIVLSREGRVKECLGGGVWYKCERRKKSGSSEREKLSE